MIALLVDVNVVLDVLLARAPHVEASSALWAEIERGEALGLIPAHGLTTIFYLARRSHGRPFAERALQDLLSVFRVAAVDESVVRHAIALGWDDFEDAVCAASGAAAGCRALVTRDRGGFPNPPLPILDARSAVALVRGRPRR